MYTRDRIPERTVRHDNGQCRIWTGPVKRGSVKGQLKFKDLRDGRLKTRGVHRVALTVSEKIKRLDVPAEQVTSHLCNNPLCVNPGHLVFKNQALNNIRSVCFSTHKCDGHGQDSNGNARPACLVQLNDLARSYLKQQQQQQQPQPQGKWQMHGSTLSCLQWSFWEEGKVCLPFSSVRVQYKSPVWIGQGMYFQGFCVE